MLFFNHFTFTEHSQFLSQKSQKLYFVNISETNTPGGELCSNSSITGFSPIDR